MYLIISLISAINFFFVWKYLSRVTPSALYFSSIYCFFFFILPKLLFFVYKKKYFRHCFIIGLLCYSALTFVFFSISDANDFKVDRASAIINFWDAAFSGHYPYAAETHRKEHYQYALPFFLLISLPFYFIHEIGFQSFFGVLLFIVYAFRTCNTFHAYLISIVFLISPIVIWEVAVRSNLLFNSVLLLFFFVYIENKPLDSIKNSIIASSIAGLLLSTRTILAIPILIFFLSQLLRKKQKIKYGLIVGTSMSITFLLTLVPFIIWDFNKFILFNPLINQSNKIMPFYLAAPFILLAIAQGVFSRYSEKKYLLQSALNLLCCTLTYCGYYIFKEGFHRAFFENVIDLSYFIFPLTFLAASFSIPSNNQTTYETTIKSLQ